MEKKTIFKYLKEHLSDIFILLIIVIFLLSGRFNALIEQGKAFFNTEKGKIAGSLIGNSINQKEIINLAELKGKVILLDFWATWCGPCRQEIPGFIELYNSYHKKDFVIIGVALDDTDKKDILSFINEYKINYPVIYGKEANIKGFGEIVTIPTTYLIDREGKIYKKYVGFHFKSTFESELKKIL